MWYTTGVTVGVMRPWCSAYRTVLWCLHIIWDA